MKIILLLGTLLAGALLLPAQVNTPVRLALIVESPDAATAAAVLTADLSSHKNLQLLERDEIEKVYREQAWSAANKNYLKLGQILGADGLLLLETIKAGTNQPPNLPFAAPRTLELKVRLMAVKPGVVLAAEKFIIPEQGLAEWSGAFAGQLDRYLPKLAVLPKDAIPISVVNLRSAVSSATAKDTERQLKLLAIQRLSREPQLFVLEREQMPLLAGEKDLNLDDSAFWKGSYLLEGVVDQDGYTEETITLSARLTPPLGGEPVQLEVSAARTNLPEVADQLAMKLNTALKVRVMPKKWNAAEEAKQYYEEAKWAMRWRIRSEAQMAADSAWVLGKRDLESATVRTEAYVQAVPRLVTDNRTYYQDGKPMNQVHLSEAPDPRSCELALQALRCYEEFSRISPDGEPKVLAHASDWRQRYQSDWYELGIDVIIAASGVLQHYHQHPEVQPPIAGQLEALRAQTRSVAALIAQSPSVKASYYVGDRVVGRDELHQNFVGWPDYHSYQKLNIFECSLRLGCFWQESPEDGVKLYRELMASPLFFCIHQGLWFREAGFPRLIAWNAEGEKQVPAVWHNYVNELKAATNYYYQFEGNALDCADVKTKAWAGKNPNVEKNQKAVDADPAWRASRACLLDFIGANYESIVRASVNLPVNDWGIGSLLGEKTEYLARFAAIQEAHRITASDLIKEQASRHNGALNPSPPVARPSQAPPWSAPARAQTAAVAKGPSVTLVSNPPLAVGTKVLLVNKFLPIPLAGLPGDKPAHVVISAHHWQEGKLVLDLQYGAFVYSFDEHTNWQGTRNVTFPAIAILDPVTEHWQVIGCPEVELVAQNGFYHHTVLYRDEVFTSAGGQVRKYDAAKKIWRPLNLPEVGDCELFTVNDRLFAANTDLIVEILEPGTRTRILASNRRRPPVSALDTDDLGTPALFGGPDRSLRAAVGDKIVTWDGNDWRSVCSAPQSTLPPAISSDAALFFAAGGNSPVGIWRLPTDRNHMELCLGSTGRRGMGLVGTSPENESKPTWQLPADLSLLRLPAASRGADLYLLVDHAKSENIVNEEQHVIIGKRILPQNGSHAELLCFSANYTKPQRIPLKFDGEAPNLPVSGDQRGGGFMLPTLPAGWLVFSTNYLFCGRETFGALSSGGGDPKSPQPPAGVWMVSLAEIDAQIAQQKQAQLVQQAQAEVRAKQTDHALLDKYDHNRNGVMEAEERLEALRDAAFISAELEAIDANHNGYLDAAELAYFDANQNQLLEPIEQTGMELAQTLWAGQCLRKFDANGDGQLDRTEFRGIPRQLLESNAQSIPGFTSQFPDYNHDHYVDAAELEFFLNQWLLNELLPQEAARLRQQMVEPGILRNSRKTVKSFVDAYWRGSRSLSQVLSLEPPGQPSSQAKPQTAADRQQVLERLQQQRELDSK